MLFKDATQQLLEIDQIKEGVVLLKDKSIRGIVMVSSQNFALKSEDEQNAIIYQFQNFLNSLDFQIEIVVQSRRLNITGYLDKLKELEQNQTNDLLKIQTAEYQKFIRELIGGGSIMSKSFFVVIPFFPVGMPGAAAAKGLFKKKESAKSTPAEEQFQRAKLQLWQRMEFTVLGLKSCGLQCVPLTTAEIIELFWCQYHPEEAEVGYYPEIPQELIQ
jgi:hypothetical protein